MNSWKVVKIWTFGIWSVLLFFNLLLIYFWPRLLEIKITLARAIRVGKCDPWAGRHLDKALYLCRRARVLQKARAEQRTLPCLSPRQVMYLSPSMGRVRAHLLPGRLIETNCCWEKRERGREWKGVAGRFSRNRSQMESPRFPLIEETWCHFPQPYSMWTFPGIQPEPRQWPQPLQWQRQILNLLRRKGTPDLSFQTCMGYLVVQMENWPLGSAPPSQRKTWVLVLAPRDAALPGPDAWWRTFGQHVCPDIKGRSSTSLVLDRFGGLWLGPRTSCLTESGWEGQSRRAAESAPLVWHFWSPLQPGEVIAFSITLSGLLALGDSGSDWIRGLA